MARGTIKDTDSGPCCLRCGSFDIRLYGDGKRRCHPCKMAHKRLVYVPRPRRRGDVSLSVCQRCGTEFSHPARAVRKYCSISCASTANARRSNLTKAERGRSRQRRYRDRIKNTPEYKAKQRHFRRIRRARERGCAEHFTVAQEKELFLRQGGKCAICRCRVKEGTYHRDHIVPLASGGDDTIRNIQITCPDCNMAKGAMHPVEFMQSLGYLL